MAKPKDNRIQEQPVNHLDHGQINEDLNKLSFQVRELQDTRLKIWVTICVVGVIAGPLLTIVGVSAYDTGKLLKKTQDEVVQLRAEAAAISNDVPRIPMLVSNEVSKAKTNLHSIISNAVSEEAAKASQTIELELLNPNGPNAPGVGTMVNFFVQTGSTSIPIVSIIADHLYSPPPALMAAPSTLRRFLDTQDGGTFVPPWAKDMNLNADGVAITLKGVAHPTSTGGILARIALMQPGAAVKTNRLMASKRSNRLAVPEPLAERA